MIFGSTDIALPFFCVLWYNLFRINRRVYIMVKCNRDCRKCSKLNVRTDGKGYPFGYDCLKYGDSVFPSHFEDTKEFDDPVSKE